MIMKETDINIWFHWDNTDLIRTQITKNSPWIKYETKIKSVFEKI